MNIKTKNPVIIDKQKVSPKDYYANAQGVSVDMEYLPTEEISAGDVKVVTKYPVVLDGSDISPRDYYANATGDVDVDMDYLPTEEVTAGDIKVVTKYPVILDGRDVSPRDYYSNVSGAPILSPEALAAIEKISKETGKQPTTAEKDAAKQKGVFWDNAKQAWQSFAQSDLGKMTIAQVDAALTARREARYGAGQGGAFFPEQQQTQTQTGMSTTTKVLLIGGGLLVVGLIVYAIAKGSSK
jgi:hypothetical protein